MIDKVLIAGIVVVLAASAVVVVSNQTALVGLIQLQEEGTGEAPPAGGGEAAPPAEGSGSETQPNGGMEAPAGEGTGMPEGSWQPGEAGMPPEGEYFPPSGYPEGFPEGGIPGGFPGEGIPAGMPPGGQPTASPGGCTSEQECMAYCMSNPSDPACGMGPPGGMPGGAPIPPGEGFGGPGGCANEAECIAYCDSNPNNPACAYAHGTQAPEEMQQVQTGPGGCSSYEECRAYCEANPADPECGAGPVGDEGFREEFTGPGGCRTRQECKAYCKVHPEECGIFGGRPEDVERRKHEGKGPPTEIPAEVVSVGAEQEFIDMLCLGFRSGVECHFFGVIDAAKREYARIAGELGVEIELSSFDSVKGEATSRIDAVCSATPATYTSAVGDAMGFMESDEVMEPMESMAEKISEKVMERIDEKMEQIENLRHALYENPDDQDARNNMEGLTVQVRDLEDKMRTAFSTLHENIQGVEGQCSEVEGEMFKKQLEFTKKIFKLKIDEMREQKLKMQAAGFKTTLFEELIAWMSGKKNQMDSLQSVEEMEAFFEEMDSARLEWDEKFERFFSAQILDEFAETTDEAIKKIEAGIAEAEGLGLDTSRIQALAGELEGLVDELEGITGKDAEERYREPEFEKVIELMVKIRAKFVEVRAEWDELRKLAAGV